MSNEQPGLWALDLDQTMLDTDKIFSETAALSKELGITGGDNLYGARAAVESTGGSFDTDGFLRKAGASDEECSQLWEVVGKNEHQRAFLYPDTAEFLETLDELGEPYLIVTFGALRTQLPKLRATGLDMKPYLVTEIKKKGELIQAWHDDEGYRVTASHGETLKSNTVRLVDDKPSSFAGLPQDSAGFLVQRRAPKPSQMGTVPNRIVKVTDLATITATLRSKLM